MTRAGTERTVKRTVSDPSGIRHKLDWNHSDWLNRTVCGKKSNLANGWTGVPVEWTEDCEVCFEG